jgi:DNA ligase (NAD+)
VLTGKLEKMTRPEVSQMLEAAGAKILKAVSKNVDYVIVGEKAGSKHEKALKLGITVISEKGLFELFGDYLR